MQWNSRRMLKKVVTNGHGIRKNSCMTNIGRKLLFNSFIDFSHFEACEYVTYSKYNKKRKTEIADQFYI